MIKFETDINIGKSNIETDGSGVGFLDSFECDVHVSMDNVNGRSKDCVSIWASNENDVFICINLNHNSTKKLIDSLETCLSFFELEKSLRDEQSV